MNGYIETILNFPRTYINSKNAIIFIHDLSLFLSPLALPEEFAKIVYVQKDTTNEIFISFYTNFHPANR